jgi:hypothetical protein
MEIGSPFFKHLQQNYFQIFVQNYYEPTLNFPGNLMHTLKYINILLNDALWECALVTPTALYAPILLIMALFRSLLLHEVNNVVSACSCIKLSRYTLTSDLNATSCK